MRGHYLRDGSTMDCYEQMQMKTWYGDYKYVVILGIVVENRHPSDLHLLVATGLRIRQQIPIRIEANANMVGCCCQQL